MLLIELKNYVVKRMSKCWYCNNELTSEDNPKHFGICNKCYDEMFKSGDTIIRSLTNKITELQKQLEEKDKKIETLQTHFKKTQELLAREMGGSTIVIDNLQKEMKQALANQKDYYEKKLKSQPAEIVEKIRETSILDVEEYYKITEEELDTILKDYQK